MQVRIILSYTLLLLGLILLFFPQRKFPASEIPPDLMLEKIMEKDHYYSIFKVSHLLKNKESQMQLVDIRPEEEYLKFSLPGAVNIPLKQILDKKWESFFVDNTHDIVFYCHGEMDAAKAWYLCTQVGYPDTYVMQGGLNNWFRNIHKLYDESFDFNNADVPEVKEKQVNTGGC
jgi:rhodanese-related sulfurtransferase